MTKRFAETGAVELDPPLLQLLGHHFGDGLVYLRERSERPQLEKAVRLGLVSTDGYLTSDGIRVLARHANE